MGSKNEPLTARALRFCDEYVSDPKRSAAAAVRRAGYATGKNEKSAGVQATRLLRDVRVQARIAELEAGLREKNALTTTMILEECRRVAGVNMCDFFREDGSMIPPGEWTREMGAAVASVDFDSAIRRGADGEAQVVTFVSKLRLWSKNGGIELGMRHLGLLKDELTLKGNPLEELVNYVANKGHGLPVKP